MQQGRVSWHMLPSCVPQPWAHSLASRRVCWVWLSGPGEMSVWILSHGGGHWDWPCTSQFDMGLDP